MKTLDLLFRGLQLIVEHAVSVEGKCKITTDSIVNAAFLEAFIWPAVQTGLLFSQKYVVRLDITGNEDTV